MTTARSSVEEVDFCCSKAANNQGCLYLRGSHLAWICIPEISPSKISLNHQKLAWLMLQVWLNHRLPSLKREICQGCLEIWTLFIKKSTQFSLKGSILQINKNLKKCFVPALSNWVIQLKVCFFSYFLSFSSFSSPPHFYFNQQFSSVKFIALGLAFSNHTHFEEPLAKEHL